MSDDSDYKDLKRKYEILQNNCLELIMERDKFRAMCHRTNLKNDVLRSKINTLRMKHKVEKNYET
jgi:hypothetical protein